MTTLSWSLVVCGAGTAGYWLALDLAGCSVARSLEDVVVCDRAVIRNENVITCPLYARHIGRPKAERLAELFRDRLTRVSVTSIHCSVEELRWDDILRDSIRRKDHSIVVVAGLDNWQSRLSLAEDLRHADGLPVDDMVLITVGLDRGQAAVGVFGARLMDPCPGCGLSTLPGSEPCVVWSKEHTLQRGNLHREARAAARFVRRVVSDVVGPTQGRETWINTKTNLFEASASRRKYGRLTRHCRKQGRCFGPHTTAAPLRWDTLHGSAIFLGSPSLAIEEHQEMHT